MPYMYVRLAVGQRKYAGAIKSKRLCVLCDLKLAGGCILGMICPVYKSLREQQLPVNIIAQCSLHSFVNLMS